MNLKQENNILEKKKTNNTLIKLPALLIINNICSFLQMNDIISLASTNSVLKNMVFSPIFFTIREKIITNDKYKVPVKEIIA